MTPPCPNGAQNRRRDVQDDLFSILLAYLWTQSSSRTFTWPPSLGGNKQKRWRLWYACVAQRASSESLEIAQDKWHKLALLAANSLGITGRPARVGHGQNNGKNTWFMFIMLACQYYAPAQCSVPASMGCLLKDNGVDRPRSSAKKYGRVAKHQMAINIPSSPPPTMPFNRLCETCSCIQSCIHLFSHSFALHIRVLGRAFVCATTLKYAPAHPSYVPIE